MPTPTLTCPRRASAAAACDAALPRPVWVSHAHAPLPSFPLAVRHWYLVQPKGGLDLARLQVELFAHVDAARVCAQRTGKGGGERAGGGCPVGGCDRPSAPADDCGASRVRGAPRCIQSARAAEAAAWPRARHSCSSCASRCRARSVSVNSKPALTYTSICVCACVGVLVRRPFPFARPPARVHARTTLARP
jgi:hypothetical protein